MKKRAIISILIIVVIALVVASLILGSGGSRFIIPGEVESEIGVSLEIILHNTSQGVQVTGNGNNFFTDDGFYISLRDYNISMKIIDDMAIISAIQRNLLAGDVLISANYVGEGS